MSSPTLVLFDADCGICQASAAWLRRRASPEALEVRPLQSAEAIPGAPPIEVLRCVIHVRDPSGTWHRGGDGILTALAAVPRWRWFAAIVRRSPLGLLVEPAYRVIAANRRALSRRFGLDACSVEPRES